MNYGLGTPYDTTWAVETTVYPLRDETTVSPLAPSFPNLHCDGDPFSQIFTDPLI